MPYNETSYKASVKYKANNIKRVPLDIQKSEYDTIKAAATTAGQSVNGYIKQAISERMEREAVGHTPKGYMPSGSAAK